MRVLLLLVLLAGGAGYLWYQRQHNYPFRSISPAAGIEYEILQIPDDCQNTRICLKRVAYLSRAQDTTALRDEAKGLLPWIDANIAPGPGPHAIVLIAVEPGFLRIKPPTRVVGVGFGKVGGSGWRYLGQEDMTSRIAPLLKGN